MRPGLSHTRCSERELPCLVLAMQCAVLSRVREIRWTERAEDHIARHQVTPDGVEQVVNTRPRLVLTGKDDTEYIFGTTRAAATCWSC